MLLRILLLVIEDWGAGAPWFAGRPELLGHPVQTWPDDGALFFRIVHFPHDGLAGFRAGHLDKEDVTAHQGVRQAWSHGHREVQVRVNQGMVHCAVG
jgi:hypothetical protein